MPSRDGGSERIELRQLETEEDEGGRGEWKAEKKTESG